MPFYGYKDTYPKIADDCFVAPNATLVGDVTLGEGASVWFGAVLRGDVAPIVVGARSNIQDGAVLHGEHGCPTMIGEDVTVGHGAIIHAARVGDRVLVGMGAVLLSRSVVGADSIVGARALVTQDTELPGGSLILGMPAGVKRPLTEEERRRIVQSAQHYTRHAQTYMEGEQE